MEINKLLLLHLIGFLYYLTYIDDARKNTNQVHGVFTGARSSSLCTVELIQSTPPILLLLRSSLMLPSHQRLGLPSVPFPSGFHNKTLLAFSFLVVRKYQYRLGNSLSCLRSSRILPLHANAGIEPSNRPRLTHSKLFRTRQS